MSPEHLKQLLKISEILEQGELNQEQFKELNEILSHINHSHDDNDLCDEVQNQSSSHYLL